MQLILRAPFGGRINKAWGLALRKRFCRGFNFELQAAATDNGINILLAEQHSFPLSDVFQFLTEQITCSCSERPYPKRQRLHARDTLVHDPDPSPCTRRQPLLHITCNF
jgi:Lhr-like helicase